MSQTFEMSKYELCYIDQLKFEILKVYINSGKDLGKLEFEAFLLSRFIYWIIQPDAFRVLSNVKYLLLKAQQVDSGPIDTTISDISMDSADTRLVLQEAILQGYPQEMRLQGQ